MLAFDLMEKGKKMNQHYDFIKDYKENYILRESFNTLARNTFGIQFEDWYKLGYWTKNYIPYSIKDGDVIVSNVSVNLMEFNQCGSMKKYIQLGTVMTDKNYRSLGLNGYLMKQVIEDYKDKCNGIYLFANDSVLDYYPKFGFRKANEYQYSRKLSLTGSRGVSPFPLSDKEALEEMERIITACKPCGQMAMNNMGLQMFYLSSFMKNTVYYVEEQQAYVVAEEEAGNLVLHEVFAAGEVDVTAIAAAFGNQNQKVILGFVPDKQKNYDRELLIEEDTTLFVLGNDWEEFEEAGLCFPTLSHA